MLCIGLSFHNGDRDYDAYQSAFLRRADALGLPVEIFWLAGRERPLRSDVLGRLDAVCFTGGADVAPERYGRAEAAAVCRVDPERDAIEFALLEHFARRPLPMLGICRGAQILNVFHGGTLIPDLGETVAVHRAEPRREHEVQIEPGTELSRISGLAAGVTNSSHHQAVDRVADGFRISARAQDGTVEAFERAEQDSQPFFLAVQWHPEAMAAGLPLSDSVLDGLLVAATRT
jgi:putative glutamine amidotransferase